VTAQSSRSDDRRPPAVRAVAEFRKTMTVAEQALYTGISGNMHPLYVDEVHAAATEAGGRLCFELAVAALATTALAELAGPWCRVGRIELAFPTPARLGDTVAARAEVIEVDATGGGRCRVRCVRDEDGAAVAEGMAVLEPLGRKAG
jgi:3-hydroxybutyryl-CoA dehydratase